MSGYKTFAVAGAGHLGKPIIEQLLKLKATGAVSEVKVLTRSAESREDLAALDVERVTVDYTSASSLSSALQGVDVLISTLHGPALSHQTLLGTVAKEVGIKLVVPSEFGNPTLGATEGVFAVKENFRLKLLELGVPYAVFYTGPFADLVFTVPFFGLELAKGKANVRPNGDAPISFTAIPDVARFVVHILITLPLCKVENSIWRIEGERISFNSIFSAYEARTGKKIDVTYTPTEELEANIKANARDLKSIMFLNWSEGRGVVGTPEEVANSAWPDWKPKRVLEVI